MPRETARTKADRLLLEGRVAITTVTTTTVSAMVRGEGHHYRAGYRNGAWHCSCPARSDGCSHIYSLKRVVSIDLEADR